MYKVQEYMDGIGWTSMTRAGSSIHDARRILNSYRKNWPSGRYRLVIVDKSGKETIVKDGVGCDVPHLIED